MALVVTGIAAPLVQASSWLEYKVKDRFGGLVGEGIEFKGWLKSPYGTRPAYLNMECSGDKTIVRMEVRHFDFGVWPVTLRWRGSDGSEHTETWQTCENGACIGLWNGQGITFLQSMLAATEVDLTLEQRYGRPMKATFPVTRLSDAFQSVGRRCNWRQS